MEPHMATADNASYAESVSTIKRITVAGITGAIGVSIIEALQAADFQVRALTRSTTSSTHLSAGVEVIEVDYTHSEQVEAAILGQDVVISTLGDTAGAVSAQAALIHASLAVGIKRFFPSEFGSDTKNERVRSFPFFADKVRHQLLLEEATKSNPEFSWTVLITGPFLDWGLSVVPFIINVGTESAEVFDGGTVPFSTTRVSTLGRAVVSCLQPTNFSATANRTLYIHDAIITQNQLIAIDDSLTSITAHSFERKDIDTTILEEQAWADYANPHLDPLTWIFPFINLSIWSKEELCAFRRTDNAMLGIAEVWGEELDAVLSAEIGKARKALCAPESSGDGDAAGMIDSSAAEKAFGEGKKRLDGFVRPRSKSQIEKVAG